MILLEKTLPTPILKMIQRISAVKGFPWILCEEASSTPSEGPHFFVSISYKHKESKGINLTISLPTGPSLKFLSIRKDNESIRESSLNISPPLKAKDFTLTLNRIFEMAQSNKSKVVVGHFIFDAERRILSDAKGEEIINLTEKETQLLHYLALSKNVPVSRDEILSKVWHMHPEAETRTLETHIYVLRKKIETDPTNPKILLTREGGYSLAPSV